MTVDEKTVYTSDGALNLEYVPEYVGIVGSGYIGLEFSDVFTALGSEVRVEEEGEEADGSFRNFVPYPDRVFAHHTSLRFTSLHFASLRFAPLTASAGHLHLGYGRHHAYL